MSGRKFIIRKAGMMWCLTHYGWNTYYRSFQECLADMNRRIKYALIP